MLERAAALSAAGHDIYLTIARYNDPFYMSDYGRRARRPHHRQCP